MSTPNWPVFTFCLVASIGASAVLQDRTPLAFGTGGATLSYVVLGDSTAAGIGAPYDDGIAVKTAVALGQSHRVSMRNVAVSGARMRDVLERQLSIAEAARPDLVLISAGANDVTHLTSIASMRRSLRAIVARLRTANPHVAIVITGAPDMGSPPRIPWILRGPASIRTKMVNRFFEKEARDLELTLAPIAEVTGPLFRKDRSLFADDRFHPNVRGYAAWVPVLNRALADALRARTGNVARPDRDSVQRCAGGVQPPHARAVDERLHDRGNTRRGRTDRVTVVLQHDMPAVRQRADHFFAETRGRDGIQIA